MELNRSLIQPWKIEKPKRQKDEMIARGELMKQKGSKKYFFYEWEHNFEGAGFLQHHEC